MNIVATALWTVGVISAIYAGALHPELRLTSSTLSSIINGIATIILFILVDPWLSGLTDDVMHGRESEQHFRLVVGWLVLSRLIGTILAQLFLVPGAMLIVTIAKIL